MSGEPPSHECPECGNNYETNHALKCHIRAKHEKPEKLGGQHVCCWCGESFDGPRWLSDHLKSEHGEDYHRLNSGRCYIKRYQRVKQEVPDEFKEVFDELTGEGRSLLSVQAAISYIESTATMSEVGEAFAVNEITVRDATREIIDRGVVEPEDVTNHGRPFQEFGEDRAETATWQPK